MGQPQSKSAERRAYDIKQIAELLEKSKGAEGVTWQLGEVTSSDREHILNILWKYHKDYKIKWVYQDYQKNKEGFFDGKSLPAMRYEDNGSNSDSDFYE